MNNKHLINGLVILAAGLLASSISSFMEVSGQLGDR